VDRLFKENRLYIQEVIAQNSDNVDVVLLDRWTLSGVVYSKIRFMDIGCEPETGYYDQLIKKELIPTATVLLEQDPFVIA
jgi:thymidylate kinase